ncbi:MAG: glutamate racemase [Limnochordales bacterium]|nr:glutamate racemase [Limnochordales bacterium]
MDWAGREGASGGLAGTNTNGRASQNGQANLNGRVGQPALPPTDKEWIGMFDSGVGGLSVARELFRRLPGYPLIYLADSAHVPYGDRSPEELLVLGDAIVRYLRAAGARQIVFACNTSSAVSLPILRERYADTPMIGMIDPGAQAAVAATRNGRIGLLATQATVKSGAYEKAILRYNPEAVVISQAAPALVPLVEAGRLHDKETRLALEGYLEPLLDAGIDTLVLGCTHYPFLLPLIRRIISPDIEIVDPAVAVIRALQESLSPQGLAGAAGPGPGSSPAQADAAAATAAATAAAQARAGARAAAPVRLLTTGDPVRFAAAVRLFLPEKEFRQLAPEVERIVLDLAEAGVPPAL